MRLKASLDEPALFPYNILYTCLPFKLRVQVKRAVADVKVRLDTPLCREQTLAEHFCHSELSLILTCTIAPRATIEFSRVDKKFAPGNIQADGR